MRKISTLLLCLSFHVFSQGQNAFFIPFGQSHEEVLLQLAEKEYVLVAKVSPRGDSVSFSPHPNESVAYVFENGVLFRVYNAKRFQNIKEGDRVEQAILEYFKVRKGKITSTANYGVTKHFCILDDRLMYVESEGGKRLGYKQIAIIAISREHGPTVQTEEYVSKVSRY